MKLHYYPGTDSLYIELRDADSAETREVADGVNVDFDSKGNVVGLDIDGASTKLDLGSNDRAAVRVAESGLRAVFRRRGEVRCR